MEHIWLGKNVSYLDEVHITSIGGQVTVGCYGGHTGAGSFKNEDGAFVIVDPRQQWVFTMLLDAHHSSESAELLIHMLEQKREQLMLLLHSDDAFVRLESFLIGMFQDEAWLEVCRNIQGETSCLIVYQCGAYVWWLSVGDCLVYVLHPELKRLGQYALNQRQFFEWIGCANSFSLPVSCYTAGRRQLRKGRNDIVLLTDGVLDAADRYFNNPDHLYEAFYQDKPSGECAETVLQRVYQAAGKDSGTIVCWSYYCDEEGLMPSDE